MKENDSELSEYPKFSIISINKNNGYGLGRTLASIAAQKFKSFEVIVVDAQSTDETAEVVRKYADIVTKFLQEDRPGIYSAMNQAVAHAQGEWTIFLNSGDSFFSESILADFSPNDSTDLAFGRAWFDKPKRPAKYNGLDRIWEGQPFCHQALFTRTRILRARPFDTTWRIVADYQFLVSAYLDNLVFEDTGQDICWIELPGISGQQFGRRLLEKYQVARKAFPGKRVGLITLKQYFLEWKWYIKKQKPHWRYPWRK